MNVSCTEHSELSFKYSFILQHEWKSQDHETIYLKAYIKGFSQSAHFDPVGYLFLWVKGSGLKTLWGTPLKVVGLSQRKAPELLLQTT